jgi:hypothetical protein
MLKKHQLSNWLALGFIVVLPACYKKLSKQPVLHYYDQQPALTTEAHLADIPLPIQASVHMLSGSTATTTGLTFVSTFSLADLVKFYEFEMERLGWRQLHLFSVTSEVLLVFEKPEKFCTVSVRPDHRVVIFFGSRA